MALIPPFRVGDVVYRADMERKGGDPGENAADSLPYVERLTVAKITTIERADGRNEVAFSSAEYGMDAGPVWYAQDDYRAIAYDYRIETNEAQAQAKAAELYEAHAGQKFAGSVEVRRNA